MLKNEKRHHIRDKTSEGILSDDALAARRQRLSLPQIPTQYKPQDRFLVVERAALVSEMKMETSQREIEKQLIQILKFYENKINKKFS